MESGITDLSGLQYAINLKGLDLKWNQITDLAPLSKLTDLKWMILLGNPIPDDQKAMLKKALPDCDIHFD
jgi:Leucine-rich repeat (LRR) protein